MLLLADQLTEWLADWLTCALAACTKRHQGQRPLIFFTRIGKPSIRMAVNPGHGAEKKSADK